MKDGYLVFMDSGIGGLGTMHATMQLLPREKYAYVCDSENVPYGNRTSEEIYLLASRMVQKIDVPVKALVLACNTITAVCAGRFEREYPFPVFGIEPAWRQAAANRGKTLVLATTRTVVQIRGQGAAEVATLVALRDMARDIENAPVPALLDVSGHLPKDEGYQNVVLGCTHYSLVRRQIAKAYPSARIYDANDLVAARLAAYVKSAESTELAVRADTHDNHIDIHKIKLMFEKTQKNRIKQRFYQIFGKKND